MDKGKEVATNSCANEGSKRVPDTTVGEGTPNIGLRIYNDDMNDFAEVTPEVTV